MSLRSAFIEGLDTYWAYIIGRQCVVCGDAMSDGDSYICPDCVEQISFRPFPPEPTTLEKEIRITRFRFKIVHVISMMTYEHESAASRYVLAVKNRHIKSLTLQAGHWLGSYAMAVLQKGEIDAIVPSPIMKSRAKRRTYSQTEVIAEGMSEAMHVPVCKALINEADESFWDKVGNIEIHKKLNAFNATALAPTLRGKHVIIVDDVITSGRSINECCHALERATDGDIRISIASLAMVPGLMANI